VLEELGVADEVPDEPGEDELVPEPPLEAGAGLLLSLEDELPDSALLPLLVEPAPLLP
jgi:hypothetical protein